MLGAATEVPRWAFPARTEADDPLDIAVKEPLLGRAGFCICALALLFCFFAGLFGTGARFFRQSFLLTR